MVKAAVWAPGEAGFTFGSATGFLCHLGEIALLGSFGHEAGYCEARFGPVSHPTTSKGQVLWKRSCMCACIYIYLGAAQMAC